MSPLSKVDILAVGAHPDDVELSCSGTLLRHLAQGKTVGLLDLTRGELGSRGTAEIRAEEAARAAQMMGAAFRVNLELPDGFFRNERESLLPVVEVLRACRPEIVLANAPEDRHPDHGRAAALVREAAFYAGLPKIQTQQGDKPQEPWRPRALYHYIQDYNLSPDFVVDISPYFERKMELVLAFHSQFYLPEASPYQNEPSTPISGKDFLEFLRAKARTYGRPAGFEYAEGFIAPRTFGLRDLFLLH